jgi:type I restriction enzyme, S subunit
MNEGWKEKKLEDVTDLITCGVAKRPQYVDDGIPFLSAKNVKKGKVIWADHKYISLKTHHELTRNNKPERGDILYTRVGSYGEAAIIDKDIEFSIFVSLTLIKLKPEIINAYLKYYLNSSYIKDLAKRSISGSGVGNLNVGSVRKFHISLPPLPEQKRIVAILDEAFEGIDRAVANAEKNLANARELFESYLNKVFTQKGDGWVEEPLEKIAELIDSLHKTPKYIERGGFPMVRVTDVRDGVLNLLGAKRVDEATFQEFSKRHSSKIGDIVLSRVGSYGVPALVKSDEPFCLGQNTVFIIPVPSISSSLLYYFLTSPVSKQQVDSFVAGTSQPTISLKNIRKICVPIPPKHERELIEKRFENYSSETQRLQSIYQQKLTALTELKQTLLQKAFSGELTADISTQNEAVA